MHGFPRVHLGREVRHARLLVLLGGVQDDVLVQAGLLAPSDLRDAQGYPLRYAVKEDSYSVAPLDKGSPLVGAEATEGITGNFFLDPSMYSSSRSAAAPVVLLD